MSFRCGTGGPELWSKCYDNGVAAMTYHPFIKTDLTGQTKDRYAKLWKQLKPTQNSSFNRFVYEMKVGDLIYAKNGPMIVGCGIITSEYTYAKNTGVVDPRNNTPWRHQRFISWNKNFKPLRILFGSEHHTVFLIKRDKIKLLNNAIENTRLTGIDRADEGDEVIKEIRFRKRCRTLIDTKKALSNGSCEICGFAYRKYYKGITKVHLEAHHINPIAMRVKPSETKLEDIKLICSNCHTVIHSRKPIFTLEEVQKMLKIKF